MTLTTDEKRARRMARCKAWREANKEKVRRYERTYKQRNAAKIAAHAKRRRAILREQQNRRNRALREAEAGRPRPAICEVCNSDGPTFFDHCHQKGVFRGWLCHACNLVLGHVKDDPNHLRKLIAYLERTKDHVSPQLELPV